jgi:hypothetical protein
VECFRGGGSATAACCRVYTDLSTACAPHSQPPPYIPVPCRLFENFAFMVGSAYFVAGSYPDESMLIADDFLDTSVDESEGGFYLT